MCLCPPCAHALASGDGADDSSRRSWACCFIKCPLVNTEEDVFASCVESVSRQSQSCGRLRPKPAAMVADPAAGGLELGLRWCQCRRHELPCLAPEHVSRPSWKKQKHKRNLGFHRGRLVPLGCRLQRCRYGRGRRQLGCHGAGAGAAMVLGLAFACGKSSNNRAMLWERSSSSRLGLQGQCSDLLGRDILKSKHDALHERRAANLAAGTPMTGVGRTLHQSCLV